MPASQTPTLSRGYPGGEGEGGDPGGSGTPIPSERCRVPPEGGGGRGVGYPPGQPLSMGGAFSPGLEGGGGLPGVGRLSPPRRGRGPTIVLEQKLLYIRSRWLVFTHYLSILLFWPRIVKPTWNA
jgi:hypothetical protein